MSTYSGDRDRAAHGDELGAASAHLPLPEALFLLGHDESGRARFHQARLAVVVAAGLVAELSIDGSLRLVDDRLRTVAEPRRPRAEVMQAMSALAHVPAPQPTDWLVRLAPEACGNAYDCLESAGRCSHESTRRFGVFKVDRLRCADETLPARNEAWYNSALTWSKRLDRTDATLAALGQELGLTPPAFSDLSLEERRDRLALITETMTEPERRIVTAARAAIAAAALGAYR